MAFQALLVNAKYLLYLFLFFSLWLFLLLLSFPPYADLSPLASPAGNGGGGNDEPPLRPKECDPGAAPFYIYDLPTRFNLALLRRCRTLNMYTDMCPHVAHCGLGQPIPHLVSSSAASFPSCYSTHQFITEMIFHARAENHPTAPSTPPPPSSSTSLSMLASTLPRFSTKLIILSAMPSQSIWQHTSPPTPPSAAMAAATTSSSLAAPPGISCAPTLRQTSAPTASSSSLKSSTCPSSPWSATPGRASTSSASPTCPTSTLFPMPRWRRGRPSSGGAEGATFSRSSAGRRSPSVRPRSGRRSSANAGPRTGASGSSVNRPRPSATTRSGFSG